VASERTTQEIGRKGSNLRCPDGNHIGNGCAPNLKSFMREPQVIHACTHSGLAHEACDCTTGAWCRSS